MVQHSKQNAGSGARKVWALTPDLSCRSCASRGLDTLLNLVNGMRYLTCISGVNNEYTLNFSSSLFPPLLLQIQAIGILAGIIAGTPNWPSWPFLVPFQNCHVIPRNNLLQMGIGSTQGSWHSPNIIINKQPPRDFLLWLHLGQNPHLFCVRAHLSTSYRFCSRALPLPLPPKQRVLPTLGPSHLLFQLPETPFPLFPLADTYSFFKSQLTFLRATFPECFV